jgi:Predicted transcriptional regulators
MKITKVNIDTLKSPERNVRKHNEKQIKELARSIEKFGQIRPVVIDEKNVVYCGNGLVEAAKVAGWKQVEVLKKTGMSEADKKKLMIADNRIYTLGFDDFENINAILEEIGDFDIPGFDTETLEAMFGDIDEEIESFGVLDDTEKREAQEASRQEEYGQGNYSESPTSSDGPDNVTEPGETAGEDSTTDGGELVCPKCGHVIR